MIRFEGDLWEMEDQRNWTDASYKTYSTPLRLPYPVEIQRGRPRLAAGDDRGRGGDAAVAATGGPVRVAVDPTRGRAIPPIGLGVAGHGAPLGEEDVALLRALQPAHLHLTLDLTGIRLAGIIGAGDAEAAALDAALEIEAIAGADGAGLQDLAAALAESGGRRRPGARLCRRRDGHRRDGPHRGARGVRPGRCRDARRRWHAGLFHRAQPRHAAARRDGRGQLHHQSPGARLRQRLHHGDAGGAARDRAQRPRHRRRPPAGRRANHPATAVQPERDRTRTETGSR